MKYRTHPRTNEMISVLGFGTGYIRDINPCEIRKIFDYGLDSGMNFIDCIRVEDKFIRPIRDTISDFGDKIYTQMHLTGKFINGEYKRPRDVKHMIDVLDEDIKAFGVEYADFGLIHSVDEMSDYERIIENGILDYAIKLKDEGLINHVGVTSHNPEVCSKFIGYSDIDFFMMSINPSFDYASNDNTFELNQMRMNFYRECEKEKIAISVMKPYGGGRLLNKELSPLNIQLTPKQCIQYCLDRPAVITVLPGISSLSELKESLDYLDADAKDCDYSIIGDVGINLEGQCMYCGHCQPCPNGIPIAMISKLYDLSIIGDDLAGEHYMKLSHHAGECEKCMKCENYCMFDVKITDKMDKIFEHFGV